MMKNNFKYYVKIVREKSEEVLKMEKKKLIKIGAIILSVITVSGGILVVFKMKQAPTINKQPAKAVELKVEQGKDETQIFLEHVEQLKSGLYKVSLYVFSEENKRMNETFGKSSDNFVKVQGDFKIKYSVDINRVRTKYDFDKKEVIFQVPKDAVGVDSVELMGKVREVERHETWLEKIKDIFNNDNEIIKENAINQLLENSKLQAQDYDANELQQKARKSMEEIINAINANNLKYRIEFVDNATIGIK